MELVLALIVGALQIYLLCWVLLGIFGMLAVAYLDVRASLCDLAAWMCRH